MANLFKDLITHKKVKIKYPEIRLKKFHVSSPNLPKPLRFPKIRLPKIHLKKLNAEKKSEAAKNISPKKTKKRENKKTIDLDKELKKRTEEIKEIEKLAPNGTIVEIRP